MPSPRRQRKCVFLARHGQSVANLEKRVSGQLDTPLSTKGRAQANWLCDVLRDETLTAIYSSTLSRTLDTALPTASAHALAIQSLDELQEIHYGDRQGEPLAALAIGRQRQTAESGESDQAFSGRVTRCLDRILANLSGSVLIVGHRKTNEVILTHLLSPSLTGETSLNIKNKYLYEIELEPRRSVSTIRLGGTRHGLRYPGIHCD